METRCFSTPCTNTSCPLNDSCARPGARVFRPAIQQSRDPSQPDSIDVLFLAEHGGRSEFQNKVAFSGPELGLFDDLLKEFGETKSFGFTYLVRGWPIEWSSIPSHFHGRSFARCNNDWVLGKVRTTGLASRSDRYVIQQNCQEWLQGEIAFFRPKMIVVMGNSVVDALFPGEKRAITKLVSVKGVRFRQGDIDAEVRFLPSPVSIIRNPSSRGSFVKNLRYAITGEDPVYDNSVGHTHLITDLQEALDYLDILSDTECEVSFDVESLNLCKRFGNRLGMLQFAESTSGAVVIPYAHPESPFSAEELEILRLRLYKLFREPSKIKMWIGHNLKFESNLMASIIGTQILSAPFFDTQAAAFLLDENRTSRSADFRYGVYTLKQLALDYCNFDGYNKGILAVREEGNLFDVSLKELADYGAMDVLVTMRLKEALLVEAESQGYTNQLWSLMQHFCTELTRLFSEIEQNGSPVNLQNIRRLVSRQSPLLTGIADINAKIKADPSVQEANRRVIGKHLQGSNIRPLGGMPWVFDFQKQGHPQTLFYDVMGLRPTREAGKSGAFSVDEEFQEAYAGRTVPEERRVKLVADFADFVLYRKMYDSFAKTMYSYVDPTGTVVDMKTDCRIRPDYRLFNVVTGRIACRNPNLQSPLAIDSTLVIARIGGVPLKQILLREAIELGDLKLWNGTEFEKPSGFMHGIELCWTITTASGKTLTASREHLHLLWPGTDVDVIPTRGLIVGDQLVLDTCDVTWGNGNTIKKLKPGTPLPDPVVSIVPAGLKEVACVTMPKSHRFVANSLITHNCPRPENEAKKSIKDIFQAEPGRAMIEFDYRANEVRWIGIVAGDQKLADNFNLGKKLRADYRRTEDKAILKQAEMYGDIHKVNSALLYGKNIEDITKMERQRGKALCLAAGTLTSTDKGLKPIESVVVGDKVWNGGDWVEVTGLHSEISVVKEIVASRGWKVRTSTGHKLMAFDKEAFTLEFTEVEKLVPGRHFIPIQRGQLPPLPTRMVPLDFVPDAKLVEDGWYTQEERDTVRARCQDHPSYPTKFPNQVNETLAWWIGAMVAEGGMADQRRHTSQIRFSQKKLPAYWGEFLAASRSLFGVEPRTFVHQDGTNYAVLGSYVRQFAEYVGFGVNCEGQTIPWTILQSPREVQFAFLRGYLAGDGSTPKGKIRKLTASTKSEELARRLQAIFYSLGYSSSVRTVWNKIYQRNYYQTIMGGDNFDRFMREFGDIHHLRVHEMANCYHPADRVPGLLGNLNASKAIWDVGKLNNMKFLVSRNAHVLKELSFRELERNFDKYRGLFASTGHEAKAAVLDEIIRAKYEFLDVHEVVDTGVEEETYDVVLNESTPWFMALNNIQFDCLSLIYDKGEPALAEELGISIDEVRELMALFFSQFSSIKEWKTSIKEFAKYHGYVEAPHGRRRRFPIFSTFRNPHTGRFDDACVPSEYRSQIAEALRQASNSVIQGIASDAAMLGGILVSQFIRKEKLDWQIQNAVHDSVIVNVPIPELRDAMYKIEELISEEVKSFFERTWGINMIITPEVEGKCGLEWGSLMEWHGAESDLQELVAKCKEQDAEKWQ